MKNITEITLYDLMSEDFNVWLTKNKKFGWNFEIDDEQYNPLMRVEGVHDFAVDSFADFCRVYLSCYEIARDKTGEL